MPSQFVSLSTLPAAPIAIHEAEVFSDHDCLLRRGHPEAIEGPDARFPPHLKRGAHY